MATRTHAPLVVRGPVREPGTAAWWGVAVAAVLVLAATVVPRLVPGPFHAQPAVPLTATWDPRVGWGTVPAALLTAALLSPWPARRWQAMSWRAVLLASAAASAAWMLSLAAVDGVAGIADVLGRPTEYLGTAGSVTSVQSFVAGFADRIPAASAHPWPVHVAGHPPGATLVFVGLDRLGLGSGLATGLVVVAVAATVPVAVGLCLDALGSRDRARIALPYLVFGPFALWQAVSADALFGAVVAWTVCLAAAATAVRRARASAALALGCGVGLGAAAMLSYGLPLAVLLVVAVLLHRRRLVLVVPVVGGMLLVLLAAAAYGFSWWEGLVLLRERYWSGAASRRPGWYWLWGNLAAFAVCLGPAVCAGLATGVARAFDSRAGGVRRPTSALAAMVTAGVAAVALADASLMSKAEVERIWLPFAPWLVLAATWLPARWRRPALVVQAVTTLLLAHLLWSRW